MGLLNVIDSMVEQKCMKRRCGILLVDTIYGSSKTFWVTVPGKKPL